MIGFDADSSSSVGNSLVVCEGRSFIDIQTTTVFHIYGPTVNLCLIAFEGGTADFVCGVVLRAQTCSEFCFIRTDVGVPDIIGGSSHKIDGSASLRSRVPAHGCRTQSKARGIAKKYAASQSSVTAFGDCFV